MNDYIIERTEKTFKMTSKYILQRAKMCNFKEKWFLNSLTNWIKLDTEERLCEKDII